MPSIIHHTFAPLGDAAQRSLARRLLLRPGAWKRSTHREALRGELSEAFDGEAFLFASGREALCALLRNAGFAPGDEVIVQGYTCVVVPNAIHAAGLKTIYADVDKGTLSLDPDDVEKRISPRTKAILCQHTFGIPAPVERLRELCDRSGLLLIEDCAHILPDEHGPVDIGRFGDALLLSFGRDKAISGVTGGAVVVRKNQAPSTNNQHSNQRITDLLRFEEQQAPDLSRGTVRRLLLYPLLYALARPLYGMGIGKAFLALCRALGLLVPIVTRAEKDGNQQDLAHKLPGPCAALALQQWKKLRSINDHRRLLTAQYLETCAAHGWPVLHGIRSDLPLQKFPMFVKGANEIRRKLKKQNIHLDDGWTSCVVCPASVDPEKTGYRKGADPHAEEVCEEILSLPTHPGMEEREVQRLCHMLTASLIDQHRTKK